MIQESCKVTYFFFNDCLDSLFFTIFSFGLRLYCEVHFFSAMNPNGAILVAFFSEESRLRIVFLSKVSELTIIQLSVLGTVDFS